MTSKNGRKRSVAALALALLGAHTFSADAGAQPTAEMDSWTLSVLGGAGASSLRIEAVQRPPAIGARRAYNVGLDLSRALTNRWSLGVGLHYSERGAKWSAPANTDNLARLDIRTTYLEVPASAGIRILNSAAFRVEVQLGAMLASNGAGEVRLDGEDSQIGVIEMQQLETSAILGVQIASQTRVPVFARVRYQHGLTDATKDGLARSYGTMFIIGATLLRW